VANLTIPRATLYGGVSTQPDGQMHPNQVKAASNVMFSVRQGAVKRPGSIFEFAPTGLLAAGNHRVHAITRDDDEQYMVVYGRGATNMELRVYALDGTEATVTISAAAQTYLNAESATADDLRMVTNADHTIIANTKVATSVETTPVYAVSANLKNWDVATAYRVAADIYFHTEEDTVGHPKGYYKTSVDTTDFAQWRGAVVTGDWAIPTGNWNNDLNPVGFKVTFRDRDGVDATYEVKENFGNPLDVDSEGMGIPAADMTEIALRLQQVLRDAGATTAGIRWVDRADGTRRFRILAPYRGTGAKVVSITAPSSGVYDLSASGRPFYFAGGTANDGTGDPDEQTLALEDRFERVAAPGDTKGRLTASTMPIKLVRTAISPLAFTASAITWDDRTSGNESDNPPVSIFKDGHTVTDLCFHRNRFVLAGDEHIIFSQAAEFFNFWIEESDNIADADPIDATLTSAQVCLVDSLLPWRKTLVILTKSAQQFELNTPEILTPNTAAITPSTSYRTVNGVQPVAMGTTMYMAAQAGGSGQILEYYYDDSLQSAKAADITAHAEGYLPLTVRRLAVCLNADITLVLPSASPSVYLHRSYWKGNERAQSAWGSYDFDDGEVIHDICVFGTTLWLLSETGDGFRFYSLELLDEAATTGWAYPVRLDRRVSLTGVYAAGFTTWTLATADGDLTTAVLGPDFGTSSGNELTLTKVDTTHYKAAGDWSAGEAMLGLVYDFLLTLPRPYVQNRDGAPILDLELVLQSVTFNHYSSGGYDVRLERTG